MSFFSNIIQCVANAERNSITAIDVPTVSLLSIAADLRQVHFGVVCGRTLLALGATAAVVPDGTVVRAQLWGKAY